MCSNTTSYRHCSGVDGLSAGFIFFADCASTPAPVQERRCGVKADSNVAADEVRGRWTSPKATTQQQLGERNGTLMAIRVGSELQHTARAAPLLRRIDLMPYRRRRTPPRRFVRGLPPSSQTTPFGMKKKIKTNSHHPYRKDCRKLGDLACLGHHCTTGGIENKILRPRYLSPLH